jgi:hypothetical protein
MGNVAPACHSTKAFEWFVPVGLSGVSSISQYALVELVFEMCISVRAYMIISEYYEYILPSHHILWECSELSERKVQLGEKSFWFCCYQLRSYDVAD